MTPRAVARARAAATALAAAALWVGSAAAAPAPTNYQLVEDCMRQAATDLVSRAPGLSADSSLGVFALSQAPANWLAEQVVTEALAARGVHAAVRDTVQTVTDSTRALAGGVPAALGARAAGTSSVVFEYRVVELALAYPRSWHAHWFGSRHVERAARATLYGRIWRPATGEIVWAGEGRASRGDEVSASALKTLESSSAPVAMQPALGGARWTRLIEPVIVAGIIASLVSLFYTNR